MLFKKRKCAFAARSLIVCRYCGSLVLLGVLLARGFGVLSYAALCAQVYGPALDEDLEWEVGKTRAAEDTNCPKWNADFAFDVMGMGSPEVCAACE